MKFEDLQRKFSGQLEIDWHDQTSCIKANTNNLASNVSTRGGVNRGSDGNVTLRCNSRGSSSRESGDSLDEVQFRTTRRVNFKRTPKHRERNSIVTLNKDKNDDNNNSNNNSTATINKNSSKNNKSTDKRSVDEISFIENDIDDREFQKPAAPAARGTGRSRASRNRQQSAKVDGNYVFGGERVKATEFLIDTKNFVDESMIAFLPEICHRAGRELVKDPMELCTKFKLIVNDVRLTPHEIECVDMTAD